MLKYLLRVPRSGSLASPIRWLEMSELASKSFALGGDTVSTVPIYHAVEIISFFPAAYENMVQRINYVRYMGQ